MIYIDRTGKAPDQDWLDRADTVTQQLLAAPTVAEKHLIIDANEDLWGELKDFLLGISDGKCWYSESNDSYQHLHVDHFRPKKVALGIDKKDHGGYWWLAFSWQNYRACGGVGNVRKRDKFAVRANKANDENGVLEDELIYFLDPTDEEDTLKLTFDSSGEISPIVKTGWDFERATYTIEGLNLNFKKLKENRKKKWSKCATLVAEIQNLMDQNNQNPSIYRRGQIREKLKELKELANKKSPFSATVRTCLKSTGLPWAANLSA